MTFLHHVWEVARVQQEVHFPFKYYFALGLERQLARTQLGNHGGDRFRSMEWWYRLLCSWASFWYEDKQPSHKTASNLPFPFNSFLFPRVDLEIKQTWDQLILLSGVSGGSLPASQTSGAQCLQHVMTPAPQLLWHSTAWGSYFECVSP